MTLKIPRITDHDVRQGSVVIVRVDFNVPLNQNNTSIADDYRIKEALPTISYLRNKGAKILLISHFRRPNGKRDNSMSIKAIVEPISKIIGVKLLFANDCIGEEVSKKIAEMKNSDILMLENVRFHEEEEKNDAEFAKKIASNADIFVNDAFSCAHRSHASTVGITRFIPSFLGCSFANEIENINNFISSMEPDLSTIILGGSKISTKMPIISKLMQNISSIMIGGLMANTFLKARGYDLGKSEFKDTEIEMARNLINIAETSNVELILPIDVITSIADRDDENCITINSSINKIGKDHQIFDIGAKTINTFAQKIEKSKYILWNGPLGYFENQLYRIGSQSIIYSIAMRAKSGYHCIAGGGDSVSCISQTPCLSVKDFTHVSTGGGAFIEYIGDPDMPAIKALIRK